MGFFSYGFECRSWRCVFVVVLSTGKRANQCSLRPTTNPGRELVSVAKKRRTSVVVAVQQRGDLIPHKTPHAIDYMWRDVDKTRPFCVVFKASWKVDTSQKGEGDFNLCYSPFFPLQLRPGGRGLPLAEGPGQGPVHPHHRGERRWENWWAAWPAGGLSTPVTSLLPAHSREN